MIIKIFTLVTNSSKKLLQKFKELDKFLFERYLKIFQKDHSKVEV